MDTKKIKNQKSKIKNTNQNVKRFKNRRILITAGPTWVPIDEVRVISNIASGETGILLAEKLLKYGAGVTLVLGPVESCSISGSTTPRIDKKIKLVRFKFFDQLRSRLKKELLSKNYDCIIHCAAVSDFRPLNPTKGKLASNKAHNLKLTVLPKIVNEIRKLRPAAKLVMFKLEAGISDIELIRRAREALLKAQADLIVANRITPSYKAFILNKNEILGRINSKKELADKLADLI